MVIWHYLAIWHQDSRSTRFLQKYNSLNFIFVAKDLVGKYRQFQNSAKFNKLIKEVKFLPGCGILRPEARLRDADRKRHDGNR